MFTNSFVQHQPVGGGSRRVACRDGRLRWFLTVLGLVGVCCLSQRVQAQQAETNAAPREFPLPTMQRAYYNPAPQAKPAPSGAPDYFESYKKQVQQVQGSYGIRPYSPQYNVGVPQFVPRPDAVMYAPPNGPGGWNFNYYPPNPIAPSTPSYAVPVYGMPLRTAAAMNTGAATTSWPAPSATNYPLPSGPAYQGDPLPPPLPYHRPTKEAAWVTASYLGMFISPLRTTEPLATIGSVTATRPTVLGQPGTSVVFGERNTDYGLISGGRLNLGLFLDCNDTFSIDIDGFWMVPNTRSFFIASDGNGNPPIGRPVFNNATGFNREGAALAAFPGAFSGNLSIDAKAQLAGIEINARYHDYRWQRLHSDALVGLRYLRLGESLTFIDNLTPIANNQVTFLGVSVNPPNKLSDQDLFQTTNQFVGPQIGARTSWEAPWFTVDGFAKLALGASEQRVNIQGSTTLITPTGNRVAQGGILALPSNIGNYSRTIFGIIPEFGANFGVELTDHIRLKLGYSLLLWNHVVRPAGQLDRTINAGQPPGSPIFGTTTGPNSPFFRFNDEFFWAHSLNISIEGHW